MCQSLMKEVCPLCVSVLMKEAWPLCVSPHDEGMAFVCVSY